MTSITHGLYNKDKQKMTNNIAIKIEYKFSLYREINKKKNNSPSTSYKKIKQKKKNPIYTNN